MAPARAFLGRPVGVANFVLDSNAYWNGGGAIPGPGHTVIAVTDDANASTANPGLTDCSATALPDLVSIKNGTKTIQSEYDRLWACKT